MQHISIILKINSSKTKAKEGKRDEKDKQVPHKIEKIINFQLKIIY